MTSSPIEHQASPSPSSNLTGPITAPPLRVRGTVTNNAGDRWEIPSPTSSLGADSSAGGLPPDPVDTSSPTETRSSADQITVALPSSLKDVAAAAVAGASLAGAHLIARGDVEVEDVLTATDEEVDAIAGPLGKIAGRKVKIAAGTTDGADLVMAGLAALGYVLRAGWAAWTLHRSRRSIAKSIGDPVETAKSEAVQ